MSNPRIKAMADAVVAAVRAEEERESQAKVEQAQFLARLLIPEEPTRDEHGRFAEKEADGA